VTLSRSCNKICCGILAFIQPCCFRSSVESHCSAVIAEDMERNIAFITRWRLRLRKIFHNVLKHHVDDAASPVTSVWLLTVDQKLV
jgi:hypothetical protein